MKRAVSFGSLAVRYFIRFMLSYLTTIGKGRKPSYPAGSVRSPASVRGQDLRLTQTNEWDQSVLQAPRGLRIREAGESSEMPPIRTCGLPWPLSAACAARA